MALAKCRECGRDVSEQADKCPNCGAPVKKKGGCGRTAVIIFGVILLAAVVLPAVCLLVKPSPENPRHSAKRLYDDAQLQFSQGRIHVAQQSLGLLARKHPTSPYAESAKSLRRKVNAALAAVAADSIAAAKEGLDLALARMSKKTDEVQGITWYQDRSSPNHVNDRSCILLYFGKEGEVLCLRFAIYYVADDWLFIKEYLVKTDDQTFTLSPGVFGVERDNGRGGIWEWYDVVAGKREVAIARAVANSKKTVLRYRGKQYSKDRTVSEREKQALKNVLEAFKALGGRP